MGQNEYRGIGESSSRAFTCSKKRRETPTLLYMEGGWHMLFLSKMALWLESWGKTALWMELWKHLMTEGICVVEFSHGASQSKWCCSFQAHFCSPFFNFGSYLVFTTEYRKSTLRTFSFYVCEVFCNSVHDIPRPFMDLQSNSYSGQVQNTEENYQHEMTSL